MPITARARSSCTTLSAYNVYVNTNVYGPDVPVRVIGTHVIKVHDRLLRP